VVRADLDGTLEVPVTPVLPNGDVLAKTVTQGAGRPELPRPEAGRMKVLAGFAWGVGVGLAIACVTAALDRRRPLTPQGILGRPREGPCACQRPAQPDPGALGEPATSAALPRPS